MNRFRNRKVRAILSTLSLQYKLSVESAYAHVKKLSILLRLSLNSMEYLTTAAGALCLAVLLWGMSAQISFYKDQTR